MDQTPTNIQEALEQIEDLKQTLREMTNVMENLRSRIVVLQSSLSLARDRANRGYE